MSRTHTKSKSVRATQTWYGDIASALRAKILDGTFAEGQQLPTYVELEKQFRSTAPTVSKALDVLQRHGFVRTEKGRGMFVAENLPNRTHYALVFGTPESHLTQFYRVMRAEAARFTEAGRRFSFFYDISGHTDTEDYQRLIGLIRSHRLAGIVFAQNPFMVEGSPLLEAPGIPRVVIASKVTHPGTPAVYPDLYDFLPKALDALAARGRRRVALMRITNVTPHLDVEPQRFAELAAARGMQTHPFWVQSVDPTFPQSASEVAQLLMFAPPQRRPDALIILDDNLVEQATAGLAANGVRVPQDLDVIAHANFPLPPPSAVSVRRLGYDVRELFRTCVERIDAMRQRKRAPALTLLPAVFEEELATAESVAQLGGIEAYV